VENGERKADRFAKRLDRPGGLVTLYPHILYSSIIRAAVFGVPFVLGAWLVVLQAERMAAFSAVQGWPSVTGTVVSSKVVGERAIRPQVIYEYQVDSVTYRAESDLQVPMFGGKRKKYDVAHELVERLPAGTLVTVCYNPDSAAESAIAPRITWDVYGKFGLGFILMIIGVAGWVVRPQAGRKSWSRLVDRESKAQNSGNRGSDSSV